MFGLAAGGLWFAKLERRIGLNGQRCSNRDTASIAMSLFAAIVQHFATATGNQHDLRRHIHSPFDLKFEHFRMEPFQ